ncbi:MAG: hypothetical protein RIC14_02655 [Filomicrobium sp.]
MPSNPGRVRSLADFQQGIVLILAGLLLVFPLARSSQAGPAIGQFELKDLEAEPGTVEFQSQNAHSWNQPRRKIEDEGGGEFLLDDNSIARQRHALELEWSLATFLRLRLGIEYEKERLEEPDDLAFANAFADLELDEVALEVVTIFKRVPEAGGIGFGALAEFEHPVSGDDLNSIVFGPIVQMKQGPWGAVGNLLFIHHFGDGEFDGEEQERDKKWDLGYAAQLTYQLNETWTLALEGYGTFDRLGNSGTPGEERAVFGDHDQHRAGPLVYYAFSVGGDAPFSNGVAIDDDEASEAAGEDEEDEVEVSIGVGMLFGLNDNTPDQTLKWSVEVEF